LNERNCPLALPKIWKRLSLAGVLRAGFREAIMPQQFGSNGFDPDLLNSYLSRIDEAYDELLSLKGEHMQACKAPRARIKNVKAEAKQAGLNMAAFNTAVAAHLAERKIGEKIAALEADDRADYEAMREALGPFGNTPLGEAALNRAKPRGEEALDTLGDGPPPERTDEEALSELGRG
jgi:hypothetical protein